MRGEILRLYKSVHTWTGIVTGLALFIAFDAGAVTTFKGPLERWPTPPQALSAPALGRAGELTDRTPAKRPALGADLLTLNLDDSPQVPVRLIWGDE